MEVFFTTDDGIRLEGLLHRRDKAPAAVIAHPHPLYGGDMHNYVVSAIEAVYRETGYTTLRFNFRGVGQSGGAHDDGIGEIRDVLAAIQYLQDLGADGVELAGYSFGTWVNARTVSEAAPAIARMIMVSPPVAMLTFSAVELPRLDLVVTGSHDAFAPPAQIRQLLAAWNPDAALEVIDGCDHFYGGSVEELQAVLKQHL